MPQKSQTHNDPAAAELKVSSPLDETSAVNKLFPFVFVWRMIALKALARLSVEIQTENGGQRTATR